MRHVHDSSVASSIINMISVFGLQRKKAIRTGTTSGKQVDVC